MLDSAQIEDTTSDASNASNLLDSLGGTLASSLQQEQEREIAFPQDFTVRSVTEERALKLLGSGVNAESVAAALGVSPSRISQLLADEDFSLKVAQLRYEALQSHNERDSKYDKLEDSLLVRLEKSLAFMIKPEIILKAIAIINNAKRRGQSAPSQVVNQQNIVSLILPTIIAEKFTVNINNQVVKAGDQNLLTMPSGNLLDRVEEARAKRLTTHEHEQTPNREE